MTRNRGEIRIATRAVVLLFAVLGAAGPLLAGTGFVIEEELETASSTGSPKLERSRSLMLGGKLRKEQLPSGNITIVRDDRKVVWILDPVRRTYFEIARDTLERLGAAGAAALPASGGDPSSAVQKTGEVRRIGKFEAYEVRIEDQPVPGTRISIWLSTEVPIDRTLEGPFGRGGLAASSPVGRLLEGLREQPGYPVEVTMVARMGGQTLTLRQTVLSVVRRDISQETFEIPGGYTRIPSPLEDATGAHDPAPRGTPGGAPRRDDAAPSAATPAKPAAPAAPSSLKPTPTP